MAAEGLTGRDGFVEVDGVAVGSLNEWEWEEDAKTEETGGFGSRYAKPKPTIISGKGSCKGTWARGDSGGQGGVETKFRAGTRVALTLAESDQTGESYGLYAYITKVKRGGKWDGATTFEFDFEQDGAPTTIATHA